MNNILDLKFILQCYLKKNCPPCHTPIKKDVVVTLTTTPMRIKRIWPTLNSILQQSERPEKIYLWIPKKFKRFPEHKILQVPSFIKNNSYIQVEYIENDFGPATKLLPCLKLFAQEDKKIIVIDDDRVYPRDLIKDLLKYEAMDPKVAIGIAGTVVVGQYYREYRAAKKITMVDVLLGYKGYLVKTHFFSEAVFNYPSNLPEAFFEDDAWFGGHLEKNGIRRILVPTKLSMHNIMTLNKKTFALCMNENKGKHNFKRVFNYFR